MIFAHFFQVFLAKRLGAVEGFLDLGMLEEAEAELSLIGEEGKSLPEYWRLAVAVAMAGKQWSQGVLRAEELVKLDPESGDGYLHLAFCLHELGRTSAARGVLGRGPPRMKASAIYHYNMACYEAQLGNFAAAREFLEKALKLEPAYRKVAEVDPDLAPLR